MPDCERTMSPGPPRQEDGYVGWPERLAVAVKNRREELGLTQEQLADIGGKNLSIATVGIIERAARNTYYRGLTMKALARGLQWTPESIDAIQAGHPPTPISATTAQTTPASYLVGEVEAAIAADGDLDPVAKEALILRYRMYKMESTLRPTPDPEPEGA